ncbi:sugar ABC transporter ATP-binding protein [Candidatus Aerophobetes bacterium]|nr:sugar ABC transporter ATP-binding protein [Candidatus Aerophobetes bacterium]
MSIVQMKNIHKSFGKIVALRGVDFEVGSNEVIGLIGDNGAGKSTLIKILSGVYPPTKGEIYIKGKKIDLKSYSVREAHKLGIETVFQEQALGTKQTIWRNLFLGRELTDRLGFIQLDKVKRETDKMMKELLGFTGGGVLPDSPVKTLSGGERQGIAIGRAMYFKADLVILDEPTRALSVKEVNKVLNFIEKLKESGKSCVYISHTIANVYSVSDRFVILDRGRVVGRYERKEISEPDLNEVLIQIHHVPEPAG